ncbi:MAG: hypothetical protein FWD57_04505 [Polyangiaceae bacterium]|nr:hypothetical protein [Polyangiaceae bacterium]
MIPVQEAPEPPDFDKKVRQRGLSAIDELVGRPARVPHPGPVRDKIADAESEIPAGKFPPFWRDAMDDMRTAYEARCAYLALHIDPDSQTIDHFVPKAQAWDQVYEWNNYRFCSRTVNTLKGTSTNTIDPFEVQYGWFTLDLFSYTVIRGPTAPAEQLEKIDATLPLLNHPESCEQRQQFAEDYMDGHIDLHYLQRQAPFVALAFLPQTNSPTPQND